MTNLQRVRAAVLDAAACVARSSGNVGGGPMARDDWSLDPRSLAFLTCLVGTLRPRSVLEFGSGASTIELGAALGAASTSEAAVPQMVAIESDPAHLSRTATMLRERGLEGTVELSPAHLVARRQNGRYVPHYLVPSIDGRRDPLRAAWADLVLVDGPPLPLGGREGALHQALVAARHGAVILLDDSRRDSERDLLVRVLTQHQGSIEGMDLLGFDKGLAVLVVVADTLREVPDG